MTTINAVELSADLVAALPAIVVNETTYLDLLVAMSDLSFEHQKEVFDFRSDCFAKVERNLKTASTLRATDNLRMNVTTTNVEIIVADGVASVLYDTLTELVKATVVDYGCYTCRGWDLVKRDEVEVLLSKGVSPYVAQRLVDLVGQYLRLSYKVSKVERLGNLTKLTKPLVGAKLTQEELEQRAVIERQEKEKQRKLSFEGAEAAKAERLAIKQRKEAERTAKLAEREKLKAQRELEAQAYVESSEELFQFYVDSNLPLDKDVIEAAYKAHTKPVETVEGSTLSKVKACSGDVEALRAFNKALMEAQGRLSGKALKLHRRELIQAFGVEHLV